MRSVPANRYGIIVRVEMAGGSLGFDVMIGDIRVGVE